MVSSRYARGPGEIRIEFDPNVRTRGNGTYTRVDEAVAPGDRVVLFESEGGIAVNAIVTDIVNGIAYFDVDWETLREEGDDCGS